MTAAGGAGAGGSLSSVSSGLGHPGASWDANPMTVADTKVAARKLYEAGYRKSGDGQ